MIVFPTEEQNVFLKAWIEKRLKMPVGACKCLGVMRDDKLAAVAAFSNYRHPDIEITFAADHPGWATRQVITWILSYPFVQVGTQRVTALVRKSNRRARKLLRGIGFSEEGCHRHAGPNLETVFSYGMTRVDFMKRYIDPYLSEQPNVRTG